MKKTINYIVLLILLSLNPLQMWGTTPAIDEELYSIDVDAINFGTIDADEYDYHLVETYKTITVTLKSGFSKGSLSLGISDDADGVFMFDNYSTSKFVVSRNNASTTNDYSEDIKIYLPGHNGSYSGTLHVYIAGSGWDEDIEIPLSATVTNLCTYPTVSFTTSGTIEKVVGNANFTNAASATYSSSSTSQTITYSSGNTSVATVNSTTGEVTLKSTHGSAVITATAASTPTYCEASASYTVHVREVGTASFANSSVRVALDGSVSNTLTTNSDGTKSFSSSDESVATVNATSGAVTLKARGTTTISLSIAQSDDYTAVSAISYELTVYEYHSSGYRVTCPTWNVTYDANLTGATGTLPDEAPYEEDETVTLSSNTFSKSRYHWDGWLPYNGETPLDVTTNTFTMPDAAVTVKGQWTEVLNIDEVYVTSSKDIMTQSSMTLTITRTAVKSGSVSIDDATGDQGGTFVAVITNADADPSTGINATVQIQYTPSNANVTESATMTVEIGEEEYDFTVYGRSLPADFVIVAKVGAVWTALPADATSAGLQQGYSLTLDDATTPTKSTLAPASAVFNYYVRTTKGNDYIRLAGKDNRKALWGNATNGIKMNAAIGGGYATGNPYEWQLATTDNTTYTLHNDNSSRYLGVNSDKKWGTHAAGKTETNVLYFLPVDATATHISMSVSSWGDTFFTFTTSDVIPSYDHVAVECNGSTYSASMSGSGPYTITISGIDFSDNSGASLVVQWQNDVNTILAQGAVPLPIFITEDNSDLEGYDPDILSYTDVHIVDGATLTITSNVSVHDLSVESGSTLHVDTTAGGAAVTFSINSLYLRGGWNDDYTTYDMPRVYINPKSTLTKTSTNVNLDISVDARNYYPFAVPFPVLVSAVDYANTTLKTASTYGTHYLIKEYDGAARAANGVVDTNWKIVNDGTVYGEKSDTLKPGRGYIMTAVSIPAYGGGVIRFPMSFSNDWTTKGEQGSVTVKGVTTTKDTIHVLHHTGTASENDKRHEGWNMLGVPYMSCFASKDYATHSEDVKGDAFITGHMTLSGDPANPYGWSEDGVAYVSVPTHDFSEYLQYNIADGDTKLLPGWSFFVQIAKDGRLTFENAGLTDNSSLPIYAPARTTDSTLTKIRTGVILSSESGEASDKFGLIISDRYTSDYEVGADLEKLFGNGYTLATYSLSLGTRLAFNALSTADAAQVIPVGYRAPADGQYTFALNPRYPTDGLLRLELIDYQTGDLTDLLTSSYTFTTARTQDDTRFAIHAVYTDPAPATPTGAAPPLLNPDEPLTRKFILNGQLYIQRGQTIYDASGKEVRL